MKKKRGIHAGDHNHDIVRANGMHFARGILRRPEGGEWVRALEMENLRSHVPQACTPSDPTAWCREKTLC